VPVATGLKSPEIAKKGPFSQKGLKAGVPERGFYINPSRRGPVPVPGTGVRKRATPAPYRGSWACAREL